MGAGFHDPGRRHVLRFVAEMYAAGLLSGPEAAALLGLGAADTVAELERMGFARTIDALRIGEAERSCLLAKIREDRLRRAGVP